jgi:phosphoribosylglycinamide formyltransferase 1
MTRTGGITAEIDEALGIQPVPPTACLRLGVLASGRGSNLQALLDSRAGGQFPAQVVAVASNRPNAPALERARRAGVPAEAFPQMRYASLADRDAAVQAFLEAHGVELVVLAGYDRVLAPGMLAAYRNRLINIHPSLLPAFAGTLQAQAAAFEHGVKVSGCTVHFVDEQLDGGPIILQRPVALDEADTAESFAARILDQEHQALPDAIRLIAEGRVRLVGRRCRILPPSRR